MTVSAMHGCTRYPGTLVPFLLVHGVDIAYVVEILRIPCSHTMHTYYIPVGHTSILQMLEHDDGDDVRYDDVSHDFPILYTGRRATGNSFGRTGHRL